MAIYPLTFREIKIEIARVMDDLVGTATATGGTATTIVDTVNFIDATDTRLKGVWWNIVNGTAQGRRGRATAFTPSSDTLTIPSGTAIDNTSVYLLTRDYSPDDYEEAIRYAVAVYGRYANNWMDQSLIFGSPLLNATFYDGSGTFPNRWTVSGGTWTQESTISKHGRYAAKVVSSGAAAALIYQDVPNAGIYRGLSLTLRGQINSNTTGSRVYILLDDGIDTTTGIYNITTANRGWGAEEAVTAALTISDRATRLRATAGITDGSAVTAYYSSLYIVGGPKTLEWNIPAGAPTSIHRVRAEGYLPNEFDLDIPTAALTLVRETTRRLRFDGIRPSVGKILELTGRTSWATFSSDSTSDDTTFDGHPQWLIFEAAAYLALKSGNSKLAVLQAAAAEIRGNLGLPRRKPSGSLVIERQ